MLVTTVRQKVASSEVIHKWGVGPARVPNNEKTII